MLANVNLSAYTCANNFMFPGGSAYACIHIDVFVDLCLPLMLPVRRVLLSQLLPLRLEAIGALVEGTWDRGLGGWTNF